MALNTQNVISIETERCIETRVGIKSNLPCIISYALNKIFLLEETGIELTNFYHYNTKLVIYTQNTFMYYIINILCDTCVTIKR